MGIEIFGHHSYDGKSFSIVVLEAIEFFFDPFITKEA
jgi:hypothetical protein